MAENLPISFSERMNLSQMGFSGDDIRFGKLTMESDKYICMLEQKAGQTQLSIVDLTPGGQNISRPIGAEAAIMNPVSKARARAIGLQGAAPPPKNSFSSTAPFSQFSTMQFSRSYMWFVLRVNPARRKCCPGTRAEGRPERADFQY